MIRPGSFIRGCAGSFDTALPTRPLSAYIEPAVQPPSSSNDMFRQYQPSGGAGPFAVRVPPRVAPYATEEWLIRNSALPLAGQGPVDSDNVAGLIYRADFGWGRTGKLVRAPKSLLICGDTILADDFTIPLSTMLGPLDALNVDVYFTNLKSRFSSALAVVTVAFHTALTDTGGGPSGQVGVVSTAPAADLTGARVMVAGFHSTTCGYSLTEAERFNLGTAGDHPGYVWRLSQNSGGVTPAFSDPVLDMGSYDFGSNEIFQVGYVDVAAAEAFALNVVVDRCADFRFDVYGNLAQPGPPELPFPTVFEADVIFRNGVPGSPYTFTTADSAAAASLLVNNAVAFFS